MHYSLVDLSDELLLNIIQELLKHDELFHEKLFEPNPHYCIDDHDGDDEFQYHQDLMSWSCTSRYFRNLLAPYIFSSIKLRNDDKSGASIDTLLKSPHGDLVKEIYFLGTIPPNTADPDHNDRDDEPLAEGFHQASDAAEEEEGNSIIITLPSVVDTLLSDLTQFPNLQSLSIGFTYPYDNPLVDYDDAVHSIEIYNPEPLRAWKALMTTTYETLSRSKAQHPRAIEIRKFLFPFTKPYESPSFHHFLSSVEDFSLSVRGGESECSCANTCAGYLECVARFDELFFNHLASATTLSLRATVQGPIGLEGPHYARLALKKEHMPLLKSLHLEHIFICQELADFVISHTDTLEQLTLQNCNSRVDSGQENVRFYWNRFFDALHSADLRQLSRLEIRPYNAPIVIDEVIERESHVDRTKRTKRPEPDYVQQIRHVLSVDTSRRVLGYASLCSVYGDCYDDMGENVDAFWQGEDQVAYDRLMAKVNANATKGKEDPLDK